MVQGGCSDALHVLAIGTRPGATTTVGGASANWVGALAAPADTAITNPSNWGYSGYADFDTTATGCGRQQGRMRSDSDLRAVMHTKTAGRQQSRPQPPRLKAQRPRPKPRAPYTSGAGGALRASQLFEHTVPLI